MVDYNAAAMAQAEATALQQAVDLLSNNGRIPSMRVASAVEVMPGSEVTVNTAELVLPPEAIDAIALAMEAQISVLETRAAEAAQAD